MANEVATRLLILSDTHGDTLPLPNVQVDVAIHAGDLTEESKLHEFRSAIALLRSINAPLKLVIAGNHDFTLDEPTFRKKLAGVDPPLDPELVKCEYGDFGEARTLFEDAKKDGIVFLDEGRHAFQLANSARLIVYASPYTPSLSDWGFVYGPHESHEWSIGNDTDVVITHGPPRGVLDYTDSKTRAGCPSLFAAIARARPRMHCFGHIHEGWGAKRVTWRETPGEEPPHFTDIDNDESCVVENLASLKVNGFDDTERMTEKRRRVEEYTQRRYVPVSEEIDQGKSTLFVNAAIEGREEGIQQLPWVVDLKLARAS